MKTVLLTGFAPFGGDRLNPSWLAVRALDGRIIRRHRIVVRRLPTVFRQSLPALRRHLRRERPAVVICVGQAGGRAEITPERVAINVDDSRIPDNAGRKPVDVPIVPDGPAAYWSTLPVNAIVRALRQRGIPAAVSFSAGTFVCNHVFYGLMHELAVGEPGFRRARTGRRPVRGGFIHVPLFPAQTAPRTGARRRKRAGAQQIERPVLPSLPLEMIVEALVIAVRESLRAMSLNR